MDEQLLRILACPVCKHGVRRVDAQLKCDNAACGEQFPIVNGRPVLLNRQNSVFHLETEDSERSVDRQQCGLGAFIHSIVPEITCNWVGRRNFDRLANLLSAVECNPTVLVIGAGELGVGVDNLIKEKKIKVVESDVYFSSRNNLIADGHDLPFVNESFDAVVIQAVLEHVIDPYRCINEAYRVLKVDGLIYAETPFMYPVHLGPYDFTRFSLTGHRRLLRKFIEIDSGVASGPGQALALSIRSFVLSASTSVFVQAFATTILPFLIFWLKYCDYFLMSKPHAADFASTIFFLGKKRGRGISDEEVINTHWTKRRDLVRHTVLG